MAAGASQRRAGEVARRSGAAATVTEARNCVCEQDARAAGDRRIDEKVWSLNEAVRLTLGSRVMRCMHFLYTLYNSF